MFFHNSSSVVRRESGTRLKWQWRGENRILEVQQVYGLRSQTVLNKNSVGLWGVGQT